jgi:hypothetical protein
MGTVENPSERAIVANFLVPAWLYFYPPYTSDEPAKAPREPLAFDILDATLTISPKETKDIRFVMRRHIEPTDWDPYAASYGSYADSFPSFSSRYAVAEGPRTYCMNRIGSASRIADRALLARIAVIAVAADDDFDAVAGDVSTDRLSGQYRELIRALDPDGEGLISTSASGASAQIVLSRGDIEAGTAEFARVKSVLESVCGAGSVVEWPTSVADPSSRSISLNAFAPKARVVINMWISSPPTGPEDIQRKKEVDIVVVIARDPGQ